MAKYDYLVVGAGLSGAVFVHQATKRGLKCLVVEKRSTVCGNLLCKNIDGINVHVYGPHIFHTNNIDVWNYVNSLVKFNQFTNAPVAKVKGKVYNLPFNMNTFAQLWGVTTPEEAERRIESEKRKFRDLQPRNMEEQALKLCGKDIYEKFIKGYSTKQWGREPKGLPMSLITRIPFRFNFDNNYFNDRFQGVPEGGYNKMIAVMLGKVPILLNVDFDSDKEYLSSLADKIVYTGPIDKYFNYCFGPLEYRSLRFEHERHDVSNYQGNAVVNYCDADIPYTRIIEHKHFEHGEQPTTIITREYPCEYTGNNEPFYPVNDERNTILFNRYNKLAKADKNVIFCGRLAEYKYYDMDKTIEAVLRLWKNE